MKKLLTYFVLALICLTTTVNICSAGKHSGETKMFSIGIDFLSPSGKTVTNGSGTYYHHRGGFVTSEPKIYPSIYQGEFPLYYIGETANITVTVRNKGPRAKAKLRIKTEAYVLRTDGSNGIALMSPKTIDFVVNKGETKTIDASFMINNMPGLESGLDRFTVKILHVNQGNGEPALIMQKEGVFCPPLD
jgi:hypothetical protein